MGQMKGQFSDEFDSCTHLNFFETSKILQFPKKYVETKSHKPAKQIICAIKKTPNFTIVFFLQKECFVRFSRGMFCHRSQSRQSPGEVTENEQDSRFLPASLSSRRLLKACHIPFLARCTTSEKCARAGLMTREEVEGGVALSLAH